jgi:type II secretory pathway pseudopilin PulG
MRQKTRKGFSLIELLLAGAIFSLSAWGMAEVIMSGLATDRLSEETTIASGYAEEGLEAVRSIRAKSFDALEASSASGLTNDGGEWAFSGSEDSYGKYRRTIAVNEIKRDGDGAIVENGGDVDPDTRLVTATVIWEVGPTRENSVVFETYLTRYHQSL